MEQNYTLSGVRPGGLAATASLSRSFGISPVTAPCSVRCAGCFLWPRYLLDGPRVVAIVGQLVARGVAEHVGMHREFETGVFSCPSNNCSRMISGRNKNSPAEARE